MRSVHRKYWTTLVVMVAVLSLILSGCGQDRVPSGVEDGDSTPPGISILDPQEGALVSGLVRLQVQVRDDVGLSAVDYAVDEDAFSPLSLNSETGLYQALIDATTFDGGDHSITVVASDSSKNTSKARVSVKMDSQPPTLSIIQPQDGALTTGTVTLQVQASDDVGLAVVEYSLNGEAFTPLSLSDEAGLYEGPIDTGALDGGKHFITVRAIDGVSQSVDSRISLTVDNRAPMLSIFGPADGAQVQGTVTVYVEAIDDVGLSAVEYALDGETYKPLKLNSTTGLYEAPIDTDLLEEGSHTITARATDGANRRSSSRITVTVAVTAGKAASALLISRPADGELIQDVVTMYVDARNHDARSTLEYLVDGQVIGPLTLNSGTGLYEVLIDTTILEGGSHSIAVRAMEGANQRAYSQIGVVVDNQAPSLNITQPVREALVTGRFTLQVRASDDANLASVEYRLDGGTFAPLSPTGEGDLYEKVIDTTSVEAGSHTVTVRATDGAGRSTAAPTRFIVDNQAAMLRIIHPGEGIPSASVFTLQVQASDNVGLSTVEYALNGKDVGPLNLISETGLYEAVVDLTALGDGPYSISVRATDSAGNTVQVSIEVAVDDERPVLRIVHPGKDIVTQGKVTLQVRASDDQDLSTVEFALDGMEYRPLSLNKETGLYQAVIDTEPLPGGSNSITFRATDRAGNTAEAVASLRVDNPPRVDIISPRGVSKVQRAFILQVRVSDDLKLATVEYSIDGKAFSSLVFNDKTKRYETVIDTISLSKGRHSIEVRATDAGGKATVAKVSITVERPRILAGGGGGGRIPRPSGIIGGTIGGPIGPTGPAGDDDGDGGSAQGGGGPVSQPAQPSTPVDAGGGGGTVADTTGPTLTVVDPADLAVDVAVTSSVTVTFSEPVDPLTVNDTTLTVNDGTTNISGTITVAEDGLSATFTPASDLANPTTFTVTVTSGVTDLAGNALDQDGDPSNGNQGFTSTFASPPLIVPVDNPPNVSILSPVEGLLVGASVTPSLPLEVQCTDDAGITTVEFKLDDGEFAPLDVKDEELGLFGATIDIASLTAGDHVITVRGTDNAGQSTSRQITITVDTQVPVVTIMSPAEGLVVLPSVASITLVVEASDDRELDIVEFALNDGAFAPLSLNDATGFFEANIDSAVLIPGINTLSVRATDTAGQPTLAQVTVITDDQPPVVALVNPDPAAPQVLAGDVVGVEINATDPAIGSGVASVEFQPIALPEGVTAAFELLEVFPPAPLEVPITVPATLHANPVFDTTPVPAGLPPDSVALFVFVGVPVVGVDGNGQEWQVEAGGQTFFVYTSAGTEVQALPQAGQTVKIVATRTLEPGPIVAEVIRPRPFGGEVELLFLLNGVVESVSAEKWRIGGVDFVLVTAPEPTSFEIPLPPELGVTVVSAEFSVPLVAIPPAPDDAAWQAATLNPVTGLWEVQWPVPLVKLDTTAWVFIRATDGAGNVTVTLTKVSALPDTTPPAVSITSPTAVDTVSGTVPVTVDANDDVGVIEVRFFVDDILIGTDTEFPFSMAWDTTAVANGSHTLTAEASDPSGNVGTFVAVGVTVFNITLLQDTTGPTVTGVGPADLASDVPVTASVTVTFSEAVDPLTVTGTTLTVDDGTASIAGSITVAGDGLNATFTPAADLASNTTHTVTVTSGVTDLAGNPLDQDGVTADNQDFTSTFTTLGDTTAPLVTGVTPDNGSIDVALTASITVTFSEAVDPLTVNAATLSVNDATANIPGSITVAPDGLSATLTPVSNLAHSTVHTVTVTSGITDLAGNALDQDGNPFNGNQGITSTFTTVADTTVPTVTGVIPANGDVAVAMTASITVTFSEAVNPATVDSATLTVNDGTADISGIVTVAANGLSATFTPAADLAHSTVHTVTVTSGVTDLAGNPLVSFTSTFTTMADSTGPTVTGVTPDNGAPNVAVTASITVTFSEAVNPATVNGTTLTVSDGTANVAGSITVAQNGLSATFAPAATLANNTVHTVTVTSGVTDLASNALVSFSSTFTTALVSVDAPANVVPGSSFTARVTVGQVVSFDAGNFDVSFDPAVLTIDGIGVTDGNIGGAVIPVVAANQIAAGTIRVVVNVPGTVGVSGSGFLAEIHFRAIGNIGTSSAIDLTNVLLGDRFAQEIPSTFQGTTITIAT